MLFSLRGERKREIANDAVTVDHIRNIAAFPLAIPLMAGPGAITATMLLAGHAGGDLASARRAHGGRGRRHAVHLR